jgi:hypothetical protein
LHFVEWYIVKHVIKEMILKIPTATMIVSRKSYPCGNCKECSKYQENEREEVKETGADKEKDKIPLRSKVSHNM